MINITEQEKKRILEAHLKEKLKEQTSPAAANVLPKASSIAKTIIDGNICFCDNVRFTCQLEPISYNNGKTYIRATALQNSDKTDINNVPIYKQGDIVFFCVDDYTFTAKNPNSPLKHNWKCDKLFQTVIKPILEKSLMFNLNKEGFMTRNQISITPGTDIKTYYDEFSLKERYPYLFPPGFNDILVYKPKSEGFKTKERSTGFSDEQQKVIDTQKQLNPQLLTMQEVLDNENVEDFSAVADKYRAVQIGKSGDNVFNRDFYLYQKLSGQDLAKQTAQTAKQAVKELNINRNTCSTLINQLYEMYRTKQTNIDATQFNKLKESVTYCARKYDDFSTMGIGGGNVEKKIAALKSLPRNDKFKINP